MDYEILRQQESEGLDSLLEGKRQARAELELEIQKLGEKRQEMDEEYLKVSDDFTYKQTNIDRLTKENNDLDKQNKELSLAKSSLEERKGYLESKISELKDVTVQVKEAKEVLDQLNANIKLKQEILSDIEQQITFRTGFLNTLKHEIANLETQIQEKRPEVDRYKCLIDENNKILESIENEKNNVLKEKAIVEKKRKQFIENPLSIGYYAAKIKKETGRDILQFVL